MMSLRPAWRGEQFAAYRDVKMPPKLVTNEARSMLQQAVEQARRQGQKAEVPENGHEDFMDAARKRVLVGLVVGEVARRNELRLDPKRLNETLQLIASTYEEPDQIVELSRTEPQPIAGRQNRGMEEKGK